MDQDVNQMYDILVERNFPVTLADLKNPTSEYMVKITVTFLSGFSIDGNLIQNLTFGQQECLSYPEAHQEITSLINLHEVMQKISNRIFVKDFYLTDMTSPGAKKARRLIWTLMNFVLYANNKMEELIESLEIIIMNLNTHNDFIDNKNKIMELRKEIVLENSKQTALKGKSLKQIEDAKKRKENDKKRIAALEERLQNSKIAKQQAQKNNKEIEQQVLMMNENIIEMEETVVKSPEEYETRLGQFRQFCNDKQEKLQVLIERLHAKNELKTQFEKIQDIVNQEYQKFSEVQDVFIKSKSLAKVKIEIAEKLQIAGAVVQKLHEEFSTSEENIECDTERVDEINAECEENNAPLYEMQTQLLSGTEAVKNRLEEVEICCEELRYKKNDLNKRITILNKEISEFLKDCQSVYTGSIEEQLEIEKLCRNKYNIGE